MSQDAEEWLDSADMWMADARAAKARGDDGAARSARWCALRCALRARDMSAADVDNFIASLEPIKARAVDTLGDRALEVIAVS